MSRWWPGCRGGGVTGRGVFVLEVTTVRVAEGILRDCNLQPFVGDGLLGFDLALLVLLGLFFEPNSVLLESLLVVSYCLLIHLVHPFCLEFNGVEVVLERVYFVLSKNHSTLVHIQQGQQLQLQGVKFRLEQVDGSLEDKGGLALVCEPVTIVYLLI